MQQGTRMKDEELEEQGRVAPNMGAGVSDPAENEGKGQIAECEQQRNEEREEMLKLLRGWQEKETGPVVRWAWADDINERQEEPEGRRRTS